MATKAQLEQQVWDSVPHGKPHGLKPPSSDLRTGSCGLSITHTLEWGLL